jgi:hypothetical protein
MARRVDASARSRAPPRTVSNLGIRGDWVTSSYERLLWLPPEYRPGEWAIQSDTMVIGSGTGRVAFVHYVATRSSLLKQPFMALEFH